jgi:hypothetical protein
MMSGLQDGMFGRQIIFDTDQTIVLAPLPLQASHDPVF